MQLRRIKNAQDIAKSYFILKQIYGDLTTSGYIDNIFKAFKEGLEMAGVFQGDKCLGVASIRTQHHIQQGKTIQIQDFMIDRDFRGIGVGKMLIRWVDWQALKHKCNHINAPLGTARKESQTIFMREKFSIDGYFFTKKC